MMWMSIPVILLLLVFHDSVLSKEAGRSQTKLKWPARVWWARKISPDIYAAGLLTEYQLKHAVDAGFRSVLYLHRMAHAGHLGTDVMPDADGIRYIVSDIGGLRFEYVIDAGMSFGPDTFDRFAEIFDSLPQPILVVGGTPPQSVFMTLLHLARDPNPAIDKDRFLELGNTFELGLTREKIETILDIVNAGESSRDILPDFLTNPVLPPPYYDYIPVTDQWRASGQLRHSHLAPISAEFSNIVNIRGSPVMNGVPSQGVVFLLNIQDETDTYPTNGHEGRQSTARLLQTRVDRNRPNAFISDSSTVNYQAMNPEEFGDDIGYNETLEQLAMDDMAGEIDYHHLIVETDTLTPEVFGGYKDVLREIADSSSRPIMIHCSSGKRATFMTVLTAAYLNDESYNWAETKLNNLGFTLPPESKWGIVYAHWLQ